MSVTGVFITALNFILMKSFEIVTWHTYSRPQGQVFTEKSLTQPDQSLSLKQLISRYVRGQDVTTFSAQYTDDPVLAEIQRMDAVERTAMAKEVHSYVRKGVAPASQPDAAPSALNSVPDSAPSSPSEG